jgi:hypothetical protein
MRTFKFSISLALTCLLFASLAGCTRTSSTRATSSAGTDASPAATEQSANSPAISSAALFQDVAAASGLKFRHQVGDVGRYYFIETTSPGCAFLDYNNDDYLDVFLVQSGNIEDRSGKSGLHCALFRNNRDGTFTDVTQGSGIDKDLGYGHGVAIGDYDNDGYDDLLVTSYNALHLFRNSRGSGQFQDVTTQMGLNSLPNLSYATSAAFGDYDNDGRLDLYVCVYTTWSIKTNKSCSDEQGKLDYCSPLLYEPRADHLFRNTGKKFVDVSAKAGITESQGRGLAVAFLDYDNDNRQDIFVANDLSANFLWRNNGNGTFTEKAIDAGCAFGENGKAMAGMGIALADYDRSGHQSMYVTNFSERPNILFRNMGSGFFEDATITAQLGTAHLKFLAFGCEFFDYDADGWSDLITNNGHVQAHQEQRSADVPREQRKQLLRNNRKGGFQEIEEATLLGDLSTPTIGRGLAVGDYDNDGRVDVLASGQNVAPQLFRNRTPDKNYWISLKTVGTKSNRNGLHAHLTLKAGGMRQTATVRAGSSYLSVSDRRAYFGLGKAQRVDEVVIRWPSGQRDVLKNLKADTFYTVTETRGITKQQAAKTAD